MRLFIVGAALLFTTSTAVAQSRWTFSAGPEWEPGPGGHFYGARLRAQYDLIKPTSPFRLRFETGGFWSPTQDFFGQYSISELGSFGGSKQRFDVSFGMSAALTPLPTARFSPYVLLAAVGRQSWTRQSSWVQTANGVRLYPQGTFSRGEFFLEPGIGLRARIGGRTFQVELRRFPGVHHTSLLIGTSLPF